MQILYHATIYTLDQNVPKASAIAIYDDKILAVGNDYPILQTYSHPGGLSIKPRLTDMQGACILPGLIDAHLHLEQYSLSLQKVNCETSTKAECLRRIEERISNTAQCEWILGHGWNHNDWQGGFGNASDLDSLTDRHPIYLTAKSLHVAWVNTFALRIAGITVTTPDPPDGQIQRDPKGIPSGILFENAMQLVAQAIPKPTQEKINQAIDNSLSTLTRLGLTGVHDFDGQACFSALQQLHQNDKLKVRVLKSIPLDILSEAIKIGLHTGFGNDQLRIGNIKVFADGALGPQTAALFEPYQGNPDNRGMLLVDSEQLFEIGYEAATHGLSLAVHAIGDRANHEILNGFQRLKQELTKKTNDLHLPILRHRIEHVQLLHPQDQHRLAELGIIASMQPIHATSDMFMADRHWGVRCANAYGWRTQLDHGATLAFGSDAPVESPNPWLGIHAAVTRRRADGSPGEQGWYPKQKIFLREALQAYTQAPAYAGKQENHLGKLAPGFLADLIVFDQDIFQLQPEELLSVQPTATMVGGKWV